MRSTLLAPLVLAISAAAAYACGGNQPEAQAPASPPSASAPETPPAASSAAPAASDTAAAATPPATPPPATPAGFDSLPKDKKVEIMMQKVVPNVGKVFKDKDAKKYAKFGCKTCHGDAKEKSKDDPLKILPKLTDKVMKAKPEMVKFMNDKVLPAMIDALGEKPYDEKTKTGFGCSGCHTMS
jgi:hypothetical protein